MLIAAGIDTVLGHNEEGKGSLEHIERLDDVIDTVALALLLLDKMGKKLTVTRRVEETTTHLEIVSQLLRVYEVTIMRQCEIARIVVKREGLHVVCATATRCRVAHVANGYTTLQA